MRHCQKCGYEIATNMKFCPECGTSVLCEDRPSFASDKTVYGETISEIEDLLGETIAFYKISEKLGQGGMGIVYRAVHPEIHRTVAIKVLRPNFSQNKKFIARFKREAMVMAGLCHPNIVKIENLGSYKNFYFIIMEYVPGQTVEDILREKGIIEWKEAVRICKEVLKALMNAHSQGMLHRDIKPSNIMIAEDGTVKVADFGLVKLVGLGEDISISQARSRMAFSAVSDARQAGISLSMEGSPIGTFDYMSPEQYRGEQDLDARTDVFSVGMTFYKMLTGRIPRGVIKPPSVFQKTMSSELDDLCFNCMEEDRADRYSNVEEILQILEGASLKKKPRRGELYVEDLGNEIKLELIWIPPGGFMMGSVDELTALFGEELDLIDSEQPLHQVRITNGFWISKYETTQVQWGAIMNNNPSHFKNGENGVSKDTSTHPVECVSWNDCQNYLMKLCIKTKKKYRLPTEAEWEYACRAMTNTVYYYGMDPIVLERYAWYSRNSGGATHPVGLKQPNSWGLFDMFGNVFEWCQDWYDEDYYKDSLVDDPAGPETGECRVIRGGSCYDAAVFCRSSDRNKRKPTERLNDCGFRVVLSDHGA